MKKHTSIRNTAMNLLARREHSASELLQKLKQRDHDADEILLVIEQLQADNLQSDTRFAESFINQRANSGRGPVKIRHELTNAPIRAADRLRSDTSCGKKALLKISQNRYWSLLPTNGRPIWSSSEFVNSVVISRQTMLKK